MHSFITPCGGCLKIYHVVPGTWKYSQLHLSLLPALSCLWLRTDVQEYVAPHEGENGTVLIHLSLSALKGRDGT